MTGSVNWLSKQGRGEGGLIANQLAFKGRKEEQMMKSYFTRSIFLGIMLLSSAVVLSGCASTASQSGKTTMSEQLVKIESRPGVTQKFILIKPANPTAAVILFCGGHGGLQLSSAFGIPGIAWGSKNFLVRTRKMFADNGLMVAVIDAPSDRREMDAIWRMSKEHSEDVLAVIRTLKKEHNLAVWLVGTSMGTFSAPNAAIRLGSEADGLVLTSSITLSYKKWEILSSHPNGILDMDLGGIALPALIVSHKDDQCELTPAIDAEKLKEALKNSPKVEILYFTGGKRPLSGPCDALSAHGFYGIEEQPVSAIAEFIKSNSK